MSKDQNMVNRVKERLGEEMLVRSYRKTLLWKGYLFTTEQEMDALRRHVSSLDLERALSPDKGPVRASKEDSRALKELKKFSLLKKAGYKWRADVVRGAFFQKERD